VGATGATATAAAATAAQRADGGAAAYIGADQAAATAGAMMGAAAASLHQDSVQTRGETSADTTMGAAAPIRSRTKRKAGKKYRYIYTRFLKTNGYIYVRNLQPWGYLYGLIWPSHTETIHSYLLLSSVTLGLSLRERNPSDVNRLERCIVHLQDECKLSLICE